MAKKSAKSNDNMLVMAVSTVGALAAASVARRAVGMSWKAVTGTVPPDDPRSRETDWTVAILWAVASGAAVGVARLVIERQIAGRLGNHAA